jgi:lysophospholipase L1-like esterase
VRSPEAVAAGSPGIAGGRTLEWVALGDSFTAGISPDELGWTRIVFEWLSLSRRAELTNLARVGARVAEVEREQLPRLAEHRPDVITAICGGNDVIGTVRPAHGKLERDLDRLFGRLRAAAPGAAILSATYPAIAANALRPRTRRRILEGLRALNESIRGLSSRHGVRCVELADHPGQSRRSNYAADGIHPSPRGQRAAAIVLGSEIEALLTDEEGR